MRVCSCGFVLYPFMGVNYKEFACFKCGRTEEFFNSCEEIKDDKLDKEAKGLKKKFYDETEINGGMHESQFLDELKRLEMLNKKDALVGEGVA